MGFTRHRRFKVSIHNCFEAGLANTLYTASGAVLFFSRDILLVLSSSGIVLFVPLCRMFSSSLCSAKFKLVLHLCFSLSVSSDYTRTW